MRGWVWVAMGVLGGALACGAVDDVAATGPVQRMWTNRVSNKQLKMSVVKLDTATGTITLLDPATKRSVETPLVRLSDYDLDYLRTSAAAGERTAEITAIDTALMAAKKSSAASASSAGPGASASTSPTGALPPRTWTRTEGNKTIDASLVGRTAATVWLLKVGADQPLTIALSQLSQADQDYIKALPAGLLYGPPATAVPVPMPAVVPTVDLAAIATAATPPADTTPDPAYTPANGLPAAPAVRVWTNTSGKTFEGILLDYNNGFVRLKRLSDDKVTTIKLSSLKESDQEYVRTHSKPADQTGDMDPEPAPAPAPVAPAPTAPAPKAAPAAPAPKASAPPAANDVVPAPAKSAKSASSKPAAGDDDVPSSGGGAATGTQVKGMVKGLINGHPGAVE